jgi:hypothetical protein
VFTETLAQTQCSQIIPLSDRLHRGIILASEPDSHLGSSHTWREELLRLSWSIRYVDDGGLDDGEPFELVTCLGESVHEPKSWEMQDIGRLRKYSFRREIIKTKVLVRLHLI